jgi:hypothetical protein
LIEITDEVVILESVTNLIHINTIQKIFEFHFFIDKKMIVTGRFVQKKGTNTKKTDLRVVFE